MLLVLCLSVFTFHSKCYWMWRGCPHWWLFSRQQLLFTKGMCVCCSWRTISPGTVSTLSFILLSFTFTSTRIAWVDSSSNANERSHVVAPSREDECWVDVGNATSLAFFCFLFFSSSSRSHFQDFSFLPQKIPLVICVEHSNTYSPLFPFHCFLLSSVQTWEQRLFYVSTVASCSFCSSSLSALFFFFLVEAGSGVPAAIQA